MADTKYMEQVNLNPITALPVEVMKKINNKKIIFNDEDTKNNASKVLIDYENESMKSIFNLPSSMLSNLYNFQKEGIEFAIKKGGRFLLADEMGVGKTIQAIGVSAMFQEEWPVMILCPSSLKYNWRDEILNWLKDIVTKKEVQIIKSAKCEFKSDVKFFIMSYDISIRIHEKIKEKNFKFAIADEAHYLKNRETQRCKLMMPILQKCKRLMLLSGTPILAKPVEIFSLLKILRPDIFTSFKNFATRYCDPKVTPYGIDYNGSCNARELHFILNNFMIRRLKKDVLSELPPKKRQKVEVQTDKKIVNQIRVLLNKVPKLDSDNIFKSLGIEEEVEKDDELSCFTKAYALSGKAKIQGIKEYISYLVDSIYYITSR